jgi:hypothetical protein
MEQHRALIFAGCAHGKSINWHPNRVFALEAHRLKSGGGAAIRNNSVGAVRAPLAKTGLTRLPPLDVG